MPKKMKMQKTMIPAVSTGRRPARYDIRGKIGLIDADLLDNGTRHPNLVIMKLSGYFKEHGCEVELIENYDRITDSDYAGIADFDAIYVSKVFDFTKFDRKILEFTNVFFGGTGFFFDGGGDLPYEIEHHMPDYHIYDDFILHDTAHVERKETYWHDYTDYSIGFLTRGCFRKCDFCVNKKYDRVFLHSHLSEWLDPTRRAIYLWDDNFFGYPGWRPLFEELMASGKRFQFRQGLDLRLINDEKAELLAKCNYDGDVIFAFDHIEDAPIIEKKLQLWRKHTDRPTKLYVLSGFAGQDEHEIESVFIRIKILMRYGCLPYIMRHEYYLKSKYADMFIQLARWCNQPQFMKFLSFREFCLQNQEHRTTNRTCKALKAMQDFEREHPEIAKRYFDLKWKDQPYVIERTERLAREREEARLRKERERAEEKERKLRAREAAKLERERAKAEEKARRAREREEARQAARLAKEKAKAEEKARKQHEREEARLAKKMYDAMLETQRQLEHERFNAIKGRVKPAAGPAK